MVNFKNFLIFPLISFTFLFAGCARLNTQVTTYYNPTLQLAGKSFAFYKIKKLQQDTDIQYDYFYGIISQKLISMGMTQTTLAKADYGIVLIYKVGQGQQEIGYRRLYGKTGSHIVSSDTSGTYSNYGYGGSYSAQTTYESEPTYGVVATVPYQYTVYPCFINFYIMNKNDLKPDKKPLYHATLVTTDIGIAPNIIFESMLKGYMNMFPGVNGQTRTMTTFFNR